MNRRSLLAGAGAALAAAVLPACSSGGATSTLPASSFALQSGRPGGTLAAVNAARQSQGRSAMRIDASAQRAAERHARAMAKARRMGHHVPGGPGFGQRMRRNSVPLPAAENVAVGQPDIDRAVTAWMNSPGHRKNLLDRRFAGVGVASARGADGRLYWAMVLTA